MINVWALMLLFCGHGAGNGCAIDTSMHFETQEQCIEAAHLWVDSVPHPARYATDYRRAMCFEVVVYQ